MSHIDWVKVAVFGIFPTIIVLDFIFTRLSRRGKKKKFLKIKSKGYGGLKSMTWQDFERFCGLYFELQGYKVKLCGLGGADGGIDLLLRKRWKTTLVQCKHWKANVGVTTVREMYGIMHANNYDAVIIAALNGFTKEAKDWAKGKPIKLIRGIEMVK